MTADLLQRQQKHDTLLMTATINVPSGTQNLVITDPSQRFDQYKEALRYYLEHILPDTKTSIRHLVFAENSGADLSALASYAKSLMPGRATFISWVEEPISLDLDRGYREIRMVGKACELCEKLRDTLREGGVVWKVTGRYRVLNLESIIFRSPPGRELYVDMRTWPLPWCDMRVIGFNQSGLNFLLSCLEGFVQNGATEEMLFPLVDRRYPPNSAERSSLSTSFAVEPRVDGIRGADGQNYLQGKNYLKFAARRALRLFSRAVASQSK